jgi:DNA-binding protein Fis
MSGARWCLGKGAASRFDGFMLEARSLREAVMPEVLRQNAPQVAHDFLRLAGISPDEIELVRKLVGHTIAAVECGLICETLAWRGGNRTHAANVLGISIRALRNKIHLYKNMGISLSEPTSGRRGATADCPQMDRWTTAPTGTAPLIRRGPLRLP